MRHRIEQLKKQLAHLVFAAGPLTFAQEDPCHCRERHPARGRV